MKAFKIGDIVISNWYNTRGKKAKIVGYYEDGYIIRFIDPVDNANAGTVEDKKRKTYRYYRTLVKLLESGPETLDDILGVSHPLFKERNNE